MRYQVPQFIEVEDKIFGPLTFKQFVYVVGSAGMAFIVYKLVHIIFAIPLIVAIVGFGLALAFYKINNKPFIYIVEAGFKYYLTDKLYIWRKAEKKPQANAEARNVAASSNVLVPKLSDSKLKDLTWSLDINESIYTKAPDKKSLYDEQNLLNKV